MPSLHQNNPNGNKILPPAATLSHVSRDTLPESSPLTTIESEATAMILSAAEWREISRNMRADDQNAVPYRAKFLPHIGDVAAVLLFNQIEYWWGKYKRPFYVFSEPAPDHDRYNEGHSWQEQLGFDRRQTARALSLFAVKITKDTQKSEVIKGGMQHETTRKTPTRPDGIKARGWDGPPLVLYWTDSNRMTWYQINEFAYDMLLNRVYGSGQPIDYDALLKDCRVDVDPATGEAQIYLGKYENGTYLDKYENGTYLGKYENGTYLSSKTTAKTNDPKNTKPNPPKPPTNNEGDDQPLDRLGLAFDVSEETEADPALQANTDTIQELFYPDEPPTAKQRAVLVNTARKIADKGDYTPDDIMAAFEWCAAQDWPKPFGPAAIVKYVRRSAKKVEDDLNKPVKTKYVECECGRGFGVVVTRHDINQGGFSIECSACQRMIEVDVEDERPGKKIVRAEREAAR